MKRKIIPLISLALVFIMMISSVCYAAATVQVKKITLAETDVTIAVGQTYVLGATISPANATNKTVIWATSDSKTVTVAKNGKIKALKTGKAKITVKSSDKKVSATCTVTVVKVLEPAKITVFGKGFWSPIDAPLVYKDMLKILNIKVVWNCPFEGYTEKKDIALATKDLSDLMWIPEPDAIKYGLMGAFVDLSKYLDRMPDFKKFIDKFADYKYGFTTAEGKIFGAPKYTNNDMSTLLWAYNKEKFTQWKIAEPKNLNELYQVAKKIKAIDSKYYPIVGSVNVPQNDFYTVLKSVLNTMGIGDDADINFLVKQDRYMYTLLNPKFKEAVLYVKRLYDEKLISPEYLTMDGRKARNQWGEWENEGEQYDHYVSFISPMELGTVIDFQRWREDEEKFKKKFQHPSFGYMSLSKEISMANVNPVQFDAINSNTVAISAKAAKDPKKLSLLLKLINWMYTDQATLLFNYGREGLHYDLVNGKPVTKPRYVSNTEEYANTYLKGAPVRDRVDKAGWDYKKVALDDQLAIWGFWEAYGWMPFRQFEDWYANRYRYPSSIMEDCIKLSADLKKNATIIGKKPLPFSAEDQKKVIDLTAACKDLCLQEVDKFITGKRPMSEWDAFITDLKSKGASELEIIYNRVYSYQVKQ